MNAAIERLLSDFAWHADGREWQALAKLFTEDGVLVINGQEMAGRAQIESALTQRAIGSQRVTRHAWSNLRLESTSADAASATLSQLTFEQSEPSAAAQVRFSDVTDLFRRDADGQWCFEKRVIARVMNVG